MSIRRLAMAATFVDISREEMEDFLGKEARRLNSSIIRKSGTAGVYAIPLSENVGVYVSSSVGSGNRAMDVGKGAIHIQLVDLKNWGVLNKKAGGQSRVNRTTNWQKNAAKVIDNFVVAYQKAKNFYEGLTGNVLVDTELLVKIETIPGWKTNTFLTSLHDQVEAGRPLSQKQLEALDRWKAPRQETLRPSKESLLQRLREIWKRHPSKRDLIKSFADQVNQGRTLSPKQMGIIEDLEAK